MPRKRTAVPPVFFACESFSAPISLLMMTDAPVDMPENRSTQREKTILTEPVAITASSE